MQGLSTLRESMDENSSYRILLFVKEYIGRITDHAEPLS